jgi:hypothetical protein
VWTVPGHTPPAGPPSASATSSVPAHNCTGYGLNALVEAHVIKNLTTSKVVGSVQLCQRYSSDHGPWIRWTAVTLYYTVNPGEHANGLLRASHSGGEDKRACSDVDFGGTGMITSTTRRTCASAGFTYVPGSGVAYRAEAYVYNVNQIIIAAGATTG